MKRVVDLLLAICALVLLLPFFLVIAVSIKFESKGPIIFKQRRVGLDNRLFTIYKFRTMKTDTPELPTHLLSDPSQYVTRMGRLLRKTSLDELPQIFNIIRGDMSFVGPRPALHNQLELIELRTVLGLHQIRPGLTGWAQINGRDDISDEQKAKLDLYYLENQTTMFDIMIILRTVSAAATSRGVRT